MTLLIIFWIVVVYCFLVGKIHKTESGWWLIVRVWPRTFLTLGHWHHGH